MTPEHRQRLREAIKFQKTLALAAGASNRFEAEAAELAARRVMGAYNIDPVEFPDGSFYNSMNFANNALLKKLRKEWRAAHPHYSYKTSKDGRVRRLRGKPKPTPVFNTSKSKLASPTISFRIDGFRKHARKTKPVKHQGPSKPSSDRNRDRHSPGYMRDYMRDYMRRRRTAQNQGRK
jgi:hypothetical protein